MTKVLISLILAAFTFGFLAIDSEAHKSSKWHNRRHYAKVMRPRAKALPAIVVAVVDKSSQRMSITVNGAGYANWAVSTGKQGFGTPSGTFRPQRLARMHYSRKYNNSPMPHSVFYYGGFAVHGTGYIKNLGRPASHGCVRLHPSNAAQFFNLVQSYGMKRVRIIVQN